MPAQGVITLNTIPYNPRGKQGDVAMWMGRDVTAPIVFGGGVSRLTESVRGPNPKSGVYRVEWKLDIDKLATADTSCACVGSSLGKGIATIEVVIPASFTDAERADFCTRLQELVARAEFSSSINFLEGSW
jgi:hypothetical protein